jgi:hypothetical protein
MLQTMLTVWRDELQRAGCDEARCNARAVPIITTCCDIANPVLQVQQSQIQRQNKKTTRDSWAQGLL